MKQVVLLHEARVLPTLPGARELLRLLFLEMRSEFYYRGYDEFLVGHGQHHLGWPKPAKHRRLFVPHRLLPSLQEAQSPGHPL